MAFRRPESALVVIYDAASRVLMLQREDDPNFWQSVTGTLESDEEPVMTAKREVMEETGIDIDACGFELFDCRSVNQYEIRQQWQHRYTPECRFNTEHVFVLRVSGSESIKLTEHLSFKWLSKRAAIELAWSDTNKQAIEKFVPEKGPN
ncbi:MAG: dihydroneopterin triphosphate diphosphatase [Aliiglaciecola sp.]